MKHFLFASFRQWRSSMAAALRKFFLGLAQLLMGIVFGIISIIVSAFRRVEAFCRREPVAATLIAIVLLAMAFGWLYTFVSSRHALVAAQHVADSLSYDLSRYMQPYDTVIVDGDTLKYNL